ncbi:class I SAM-dependent methyltransferase [Nitrosopumilus sp.]|uniref:class I SAM-dependent methyltransferase n=1 Tax=Nitrosopumilus sp. TaxID=2024843 RepID=UPI00242DC4C1|nr:class I SAM-dependent methyltransferase [Nitrosopumilus sp.]MCV0366643.1 class I SAM-dependent methyltransferase [Nitrosopumilus sp.]MCV0410566.1 class I SAM-dependent methyltransferase [Nitrosopumilus sp.]
MKKIVPKGNVLDIGCSTGGFLANLSKISDLQLYGIDIDRDAIAIAEEKCNSAINFTETDLINYQTNLKFDCIVFRGSFQFLGFDLKETMKKIAELSSENVKIIIYSLPNSDSILYNLLKDNWHLFDEISHTLIFNKMSIMKLCEIYNYKIQECSYPYLETPYANHVKDNESLIQLIKGETKKSFPFWGNIMQIVLEK